MTQQLALPAYEQVLKAAHTFNLLDARGAISVTERAAYIGRIRNLARAVAQSYLDSRLRLGLPDGAEGLGRRGHRATHEEGGLSMAPQEPARRTARRGTAAEGAEVARRGLRRHLVRQPEGPGPGASELRWSRPSRRRAGWRCMSPASRARAADQAVQLKLMPVSVALDAAGAPTPALLKKLAVARATTPRCCRRSSARAKARRETLFLDSIVAGADLAAGLQTALDEAIAQAADPQGHAVPAGRRLDQRQVRAPGTWPRRAARHATWCR